MEKGWCLTLDSSDPVGFFGYSVTPRLNHKKATMFPVNLNYREEQAVASPAGENRVVMGEVDFFSNNRNDHIDSKITTNVVKKENSHDLDVNTGLHLLTANTGSDQSTVDDGISSNSGNKRVKNELSQLQVELQQMNAENERLRGMLSQVSNNYSALQMHIMTLMQHQQSSRTETTQQHEIVEGKLEEKKEEDRGLVVPRQFIDLGPSATPETDDPSHTSSEERTQSGSGLNAVELSNNSNRNEIGKRIGREESPQSEGWAPNKVPKLFAPKPADQATEATMRKARVSVRARSEAPMITDGCQWRKYGQKMAKGNPCPRAYYRCTMAVGCPVRKQVQRCADDRTILITTYEGNHNHPLPPAAMAMASTTSAAANMLLSGSMSSADGIMNPNILARAILPCSSSVATISASAPFPTVTLDLTHSPNPLQFQRPSPQFQVPTQNFVVPQVLGQTLYNQSKFSGLQLSHEIDSNQLINHAPPPQPQPQPQPPHPSFADTLSAITADPNFTAALAAAISSIMSGNSNNNNSNNQQQPHD